MPFKSHLKVFTVVENENKNKRTTYFLKYRNENNEGKHY